MRRVRFVAAAVVAVVVALFAIPSVTWASPEEGNVITVPPEGYAFEDRTIWGISADWLEKTCAEQGLTELEVRLVIPEEIGGEKVASIGAYAFSGTMWSQEKSEAGAVNYVDHPECPEYLVTQIDLSGATSLTTVEKQAFDGCSQAEGVLVLPGSLTTIEGNFAFRNCTSLTGIVWSDSLESINGGRVTDGKMTSSAFYGCSGLRFATTKARYEAAVEAGALDQLCEVRFPETLKVIGGQTFVNAFTPGADVPVWIPASVEYVGSEAFCNKEGVAETAFSQIVVERSADAEGTLGEGYDGVSAYEGTAFRWVGNASDRVVVFADAATRDLFMEGYSGLSSLKSSFTYELDLRFLEGTDEVATQRKLYGLSVSYVRGADGVWALDASYELPDFPDGVEPSEATYWTLEGGKMDAGTLVTDDEALLHRDTDPVVTFEVKFTPRSGSQFTKAYQPGETVDVDLGIYVQAEVSVKVEHPEYDPDEDVDSGWGGPHTYIRCQWHDAVTGEGSMSGDALFSSDWKYGDRGTSVTFDKVSQTRLGDNAYTLTVMGKYTDHAWGSESPSTDDTVFTGLASGYSLRVNVTEPATVLDWLVVPTEDGTAILIEEWLDFLPRDAADVTAYLSEKYDHAYAEDETLYESLYPAITWSFDDAQGEFDATPGAVNTFTWSVDPLVFEEAGWEVPNDFALSGTVKVHNPYAIEAIAGEGGSVTPEGVVAVVRGSDAAFVIEPDEGYEIADVVVDKGTAQEMSVADELVEGTYTFEDVTASHTIEATFRLVGGSGGGDDPEPTPDPEPEPEPTPDPEPEPEPTPDPEPEPTPDPEPEPTPDPEPTPEPEPEPEPEPTPEPEPEPTPDPDAPDEPAQPDAPAAPEVPATGDAATPGPSLVLLGLGCALGAAACTLRRHADRA